MKKSIKTAKIQLIELIKSISKDSKSLDNDEFIFVLNSLKCICVNKPFIENLIQSLKVLNQSKIHHKENLTKREKQVLLLIGEGLKNNHIAIELNLSKSTIETHRKNIRKKLKLNGNDNLFAFALLFNLQYKNSVEDDNL